MLIADPHKYGQPGMTPRWPPAPCVHAVHWWGRVADKLVLARPVWFQIAIWLEVFVQAPFYILAIFAFLRQLNWIRIPAIVYSTVLLTIMPIVLGEQYFGTYRTDKPLLVTGVYGAYVIMPIFVLARVWAPQVFPTPKKVAVPTSTGNQRGSTPSRPRAAASPGRKRQ